MAKIIMCQGLPASGKSTWAREYLKENKMTKRVNRDELRLMIDNGLWSSYNEKFIVEIRDLIIRQAITKGYSIIVDDTNLAPKAQSDIAYLAKELDVDLEVKDFTDVSPYECIERDKLRGDKKVGSDVIMRMYRQHMLTEKLTLKDLNLPSAIMVDIDGTLAKMGQRSPFEWKKVGIDTCNNDIVRILHYYKGRGDIILLSGRDSICRPETEQWLKDNSIEYDRLYMRPEKDNRKDVEIKKEIYKNHIEGNYNIDFVLDDRDQVVALWRSLGLTCLQVNYGNF